MKKGILMLATVAAIAFTSCKNDKNASDEMKDNTSEMTNKSGEQSDMKSNKDMADKNEKSSSSMKNQNGEFPVMKFDQKSHDFGTITEGERVEHTFSFTNTGEAPLQITKAKGSCGCTVPEWPKGKIAPGETGKIRVNFNSRRQKNKTMKSVTLTTNSKKGREVLRIMANVKPKS
jgi:hypothetical protein